ncbi:MAG: ergothioneine biosynthesis protein EgtB [Melioribacteraceae bacterium]|nr:MAG: ergothioneine biosynthesis protein EgtB [Melioribacteraceae bacterium]
MSVIKQSDSKLYVIQKNNGSLRDILKDMYVHVRAFSEKIAEPLEPEDFVVQSMPDVSPAKWHLAHTSWFFETFILAENDKNYKPFDEKFSFLFNSYYVQVGDRWFRPNRGLLSRPTVKEVFEYRRFVDEQMANFFEIANDETIEKFRVPLEIGFNHEQQHQELMITDIKHVFSINPLYPVYKSFEDDISRDLPKQNWVPLDEGVYEFGQRGDSFFYDNEKPVHKQFIHGFAVSSLPVTNGEYLAFMNDDGYTRTELWLSNGIAAVEENGWNAPLYWHKIDGEWYSYTLGGLKKINPNEPVTHISYYEADAYARWADARLLSEFEWELVSKNFEIEGNFVDNERFHVLPLTKDENKSVSRLFGDTWEWTKSDYAAYPGYRIPPGAIGEYNGKFMSGQYVLRGGSCATSADHIRRTYRNFFAPASRWQFSGIRLAKDLR